MDKAFTHGQMVKNMTVAGKTANNTVKPYSPTQKAKAKKVFGKMETESSGSKAPKTTANQTYDYARTSL